MNYVSIDYLRENEVSRSGKSYKSICPECGNDNFYVTEHNSLAHCYNCRYTARIGEQTDNTKVFQFFDIKKLREFYKEVADKYHVLIRPQDVAYLHERGLDEYDIERYKIGYCPDSELGIYRSKLATESGVASNTRATLSDRIIFPYISHGQITDLRGRAQKNPKYKGLFHSSTERGAIYPYNIDFALPKMKDFIIITEGEIKAILADKAGFPVVALPGITSWKEGLVLPKNVTPVVIFDTESCIQNEVNNAIIRISKKLSHVHVARLPLLGEKKMDIDRYLLHPKGGVTKFEKLVYNAVPVNKYISLVRK